VASAFLVSQGLLTVGFYCWILNRILDGFDGLVARERNQQSDFGGYLDLVLDVAVSFFVYIIGVLTYPIRVLHNK